MHLAVSQHAAAIVCLLLQLLQLVGAGPGLLSGDGREKWVYHGILCTFLGGILVLCIVFKCWRCCRCRSRVNDRTPIFPDEARQWCPDVYASPLVAQELFQLQVSQLIEVVHSNWPPHRVLIRKVLTEQMERERRARHQVERARTRRGRGHFEAETQLHEIEDTRLAAVAAGL